MTSKEKHYHLDDIVMGRVDEHKGFFVAHSDCYEEIPETKETTQFYDVNDVSIYMTLLSFLIKHDVLIMLTDQNMHVHDTVTRSMIDKVKAYLEIKRKLPKATLDRIDKESVKAANKVISLLGFNKSVVVPAYKLIKFRATLTQLIHVELCLHEEITLKNMDGEISLIIRKALSHSHIKLTNSLLENTFSLNVSIDQKQQEMIKRGNLQKRRQNYLDKA